MALKRDDTELVSRNIFLLAVSRIATKSVCYVCTDCIEGMDVCFILDGILILYGIILTVLYCRLRVRQTGTTHAHTQIAMMDCRKCTAVASSF